MGESPSVNAFKAWAALILFSIALFGGLLPQKLKNVGSKVVSSLNMAAGGVFFASAMVHMLPESSETLNDLWGDDFPWGGFICSFGFLLILCIDQAVRITHARRKGRPGHILVPTEPPAAEHTPKGILGLGRNRSHDDHDFAALEMTGISPRALLASEHLPEEIGRHGSAAATASLGSSTIRGHEANGAEAGTEGDHRHSNNGSASGSTLRDDGAGSMAGGERQRRESSVGHIIGHSEDDEHVHCDGRGRSGRSGHDGHSHGLGDAGDGVWVRVVLLLALSVHSVMEGLGVGASATKAYNLLFAIGVHKGLAAYALGVSLLQSGASTRELFSYITAFSIMTPLGILLGALIERDGEDDAAGSTCVALAAGTFLYVSLMEVLPPELASAEHGWAKLASLVVGFCLAATVGWLAG